MNKKIKWTEEIKHTVLIYVLGNILNMFYCFKLHTILKLMWIYCDIINHVTNFAKNLQIYIG